MKYLQIILTVSQILIYVFSGRIRDKLLQHKKLQILRIDGKCVGKDVAMETYIQGVSVNSMLQGFCSNVTTIIYEDYDADDYKSSFHVTRCRSRENLDSCEKVYSRGNMSSCQLINANQVGKSPIAVPYEPPLTCPGKKGSHIAVNFTINALPFVFFPLDDWYWRLDVELYSGDNTKLLGCGVLEVHQVNSKV